MYTIKCTTQFANYNCVVLWVWSDALYIHPLNSLRNKYIVKYTTWYAYYKMHYPTFKLYLQIYIYIYQIHHIIYLQSNILHDLHTIKCTTQFANYIYIYIHTLNSPYNILTIEYNTWHAYNQMHYIICKSYLHICIYIKFTTWYLYIKYTTWHAYNQLHDTICKSYIHICIYLQIIYTYIKFTTWYIYNQIFHMTCIQ